VGCFARVLQFFLSSVQNLSRALSILEYFGEGIIIRPSYSENKDSGKEIIVETGDVCAETGASQKCRSFLV
jgi:hypothetical protein